MTELKPLHLGQQVLLFHAQTNEPANLAGSTPDSFSDSRHGRGLPRPPWQVGEHLAPTHG